MRDDRLDNQLNYENEAGTSKLVKTIQYDENGTPVQIDKTLDELIFQAEESIDNENDIVSILTEISTKIGQLASTTGLVSDLRATILSGTVTTVTTLSNITSIGGNIAYDFMNGMTNANVALTNINNIGVE